jgi:nucleoside phosphorylase
MIAIAVALEREIEDYLIAGEFRSVDNFDRFRFYLSSIIRDVVVVIGGCGQQLSGEAANLVIEKFHPEVLLSVGYAAGARPDMVPGDVFVCKRLMSLTGEAVYWGVNTVLEKQIAESVLPYDQWNDIDIRWGSCITVPMLVSGSSMKKWLGLNFDVDLIDLESYGVSEVAEAHGIPALIIRGVFDLMEQTLPPFVALSLHDSVSKTAIRAASYTISHPFSLRSTLALKSQARQVTESLSLFLNQVTCSGNLEKAIDLSAPVVVR